MAAPTEPPTPPGNSAAGPAPDPSGPPRAGRTQRARARADHLKARADQKVKALEARRPASRTVDAAFSTLERDVKNGGGVLAAALAFRIFIFLVPFVFVLVTAFPAAADAGNADPVELAKKFGMAGLASTAIKSADNLSTWHRLGLLAAGFFALVLASRSLVRVLRITHGLAWNARVPKMKHPTRAALVLIGVVFGLVLVNTFSASLRDNFHPFGIIPMLITGIAMVGLWVFVQDHLPHQPVKWTAQLPGAILVGVGVEGLQIVTVVWFTRSLESKSETYGAIGSALAMLLWAYFLGRILVSGAMLNAVLWEQEHRDQQARSAPARPEEDHDPGQ